MSEQRSTADLAVIGGGPGGYAAAFLAADLGMDVTLIDPRRNPGGVCLYEGCIPSKTLLNAARLIHEAADAEAWGVAFAKPKIDGGKLREWKNGVVERLTDGLGRLSSQRKIHYICGNAVFKDDSTLSIRTTESNPSVLTFKNAVIATGSLPIPLSGIPEDSERILDAGRALALSDIPKSLLIVGGGYIGLEMGTVYATLGSRVTVVEMTPGLLPGADRDLVNVLKKRLTPLFESIALNTRVKEVKVQKNGVKVGLQPAEGEAEYRLFGKMLVAVGRRPHTQGFGLENTGVHLNDRGFISVNAQCRTAVPHIFAVGDVAGEPMLAHKAAHEGRVAAEVIAGKKAAFEPAAIPAVVFTDPELAWTGYTEKEAREKQIDFQVVRFPWAASGRAAAIGRTDGLTKLIIEKKTERIIGVGMVGAGAGEMIAEGVLAIEMGANALDLGMTIHPHPTLTETVMEAADLFFGTATHFYRPKTRGKK